MTLIPGCESFSEDGAELYHFRERRQVAKSLGSHDDYWDGGSGILLAFITAGIIVFYQCGGGTNETKTQHGKERKT